MIIKPSYHWDYKPSLGHVLELDHPQAAGVKLFHLLNEANSGPGVPRDLVSGLAATVTGAPVYSSTVGGIGRGGYSATAYDAIDPPVQVLGSVYPCWFAVSFIVTATSTGYYYLVDQDATGAAIQTKQFGLYLESGWHARLSISDDSGTVHSITGLTPLNDGLPHTVAGVMWSASSQSLYVDGKLAETSTTSFGAFTHNRYTLGFNRSGVYYSPGPILWHQAGNGAVPDMEWLAREPFAAIKPPASRRLISFASTTVYTGSGTSSFGGLSSSGSGLILPPSYAGTGATTLSPLISAGIGSYSGATTSSSLLLKPPHRWDYKPPIGSEIDRDSTFSAGLIASYNFAEGDGVPRSVWPQLPDPTANGSVSWTGGRDGKAILFDGTTGYYGLNSTTQLNPSAAGMTVAAWVNMTSATTARGIFSRAVGTSLGTCFDLQSSRCAVADSTGTLHIATGAVPTAGRWAFLVGRADVTGNEVSFWVNAVKTVTTTLPSIKIPTAGESIIGAGGGGASKTAFFPGAIGQVYAWNVPLTDAQITRLYEYTYPMFLPPSTQRWIPFASTAVYSGSGTSSLGLLSSSGTGSFAAPAYSGSGSDSLDSVTSAGSGTVSAPVYSGTGSDTLSPLVSTGVGAYVSPGVYEGTGAGTFESLVSSGSGSVAVPVYAGLGTSQLSPIVSAGIGTYVASAAVVRSDWRKTTSTPQKAGY